MESHIEVTQLCLATSQLSSCLQVDASDLAYLAESAFMDVNSMTSFNKTGGSTVNVVEK